MTTQKVAGIKISGEANFVRLLKELERSRNEVSKLRRTVERDSNRIKYAFNKIRRAAQVVASAFIFTAGIRQLGRVISAMAKAEDQVKLMQARFQQFARAPDAFTRVYTLSKRLGVSLKDTADGMTRLLVATKDIGTAQSDIEAVYQNIVLLGRAGGTSAEEMKGGMRQLSQGLASGRLAGEELRSVLENLPLVAIEIAEQMRIPLGQIRDAAAEGLINPDVVIAALKEIEIKMEDLPETWSMQTERLRTEWDLFLNDLSRAVDEAGLLDALIDAVKWVRINMLGSFVGIPTEELQKRIDELEAKRGVGPSEVGPATTFFSDELPEPKGARAMEWMAAMETAGQRRVRLTQQETEELRRLNEEVERRFKMEEMARKAAEARAVLAADKADEERLDDLAKAAARLDESLVKGPFVRFAEMRQQLNEIVAENIRSAEWADEAWSAAYSKLVEYSEKTTEKILGNLEKLADENEEAAEEVDDAWKDLGLTFESAFEDAIVEGEKLRDVLHAILKDILRIMVRQSITVPLLKAFGIEGRAMGGLVSAGSSYLVGEWGPELWTPSRSGYILPNAALAATGGGNNYSINVDARSDREQIYAELIPMVEQTILSTEARMRRDKMEGRF